MTSIGLQNLGIFSSLIVLKQHQVTKITVNHLRKVCGKRGRQLQRRAYRIRICLPATTPFGYESLHLFQIRSTVLNHLKTWRTFYLTNSKYRAYFDIRLHKVATEIHQAFSGLTYETVRDIH